MKKDDFYEEDDGRTIADMSGIERQPTFLPHFHRKRSDFSAPDAPRANDRPWESAAGELTREERNAAIRGALKAGLLIAGVYILAAAREIKLSRIKIVENVPEGGNDCVCVLL